MKNGACSTIALHEIADLRSVTCHMGSQGVTCHLHGWIYATL